MSEKPRRKPKIAVAIGRSSTADRVAWLLSEVWSGNRSQMARDVNVTHSVLAKIVRGTQNPGQRVLRAIAAHPKVNVPWLYTGEGAPLLESRTSEPEGGWPLRIAKCLLPGSVDEYPEALSDEVFPVAGAFYRSSRYWYQLGAADPVVSSPSRRLAAGDLLLLETNRAAWRTPSQIDNRLCAVRLSDTDEPQLAVAEWHPGSGFEGASLRADTWHDVAPEQQRIEQFLIRKYPGGWIETKCQVLQLDGEIPKNSPEYLTSDIRFAAGCRPLVLEQVVAVCLMVVRHQI